MSVKSKNTAYYVNSVICICIMLFTRFLPPVGMITEFGMEVLGLFIGSIYGWCTVGFIWPSFLAILLLGISDYGAVQSVMAEGFSNMVPMQILITFIFFNMIAKSGLIDEIAKRLITLKFCAGKPWLFTTVFVFAAGLISSVTNQFMVIVIFWYIIYSFAEYFPDRKGWVAYACVGIACFCELTLTLFPFCPFSLVAIGIATNVGGPFSYSIFGWSATCMIIFILSLLIYIAVGKYVFKLDVSPLEDMSKFKTDQNEPMSQSAKVAAVYLLIFVAIVILPSILPKTWKISAILTKMGVLGAASVGFIGLCFKKDENGKFKISFAENAKEGIAWDMFILVWATMPLCNAMESADAGLSAQIVAWLTPLMQAMSPTLFILVVVLVLGLISSFAHNLILLFVTVPIVTGMLVNIGINPTLFICLFMFATQTAMGTPGGSAASAMMFGNSEYIDRAVAYKYAVPWVIYTLLIVAAVGFTLGTAII